MFAGIKYNAEKEQQAEWTAKQNELKRIENAKRKETKSKCCSLQSGS